MTTSSKTAGVVAAAMSASLIATLMRKGLLTTQETQDILEHTLLSLETQQANETDPEEWATFEAACGVIEGRLMPPR